MGEQTGLPINWAILLEVLYMVVMDSVWAILPPEVIQIEPAVVPRGGNLGIGPRAAAGSSCCRLLLLLLGSAQEALACSEQGRA